ncbi:uncharacterized protein LOC108824478 [Raphanus sativus]|uniref:Uncharacterized protein LOC108824478 n=1 Tax=Raphanus sativus TaxID=3726 RepID=A0A6J0L182_RAPSA|nr:uncharacterized protein LOC108824478 [Raphanus sativus]
MKCDSVCQICGLEGESINHVLFSCTLACQVWAISGFPSPQGGFDDSSVWTNMSYLFATWRTKVEIQWLTNQFPWVLWYLWKNRNSLFFEGILYDGEQTCSKAKEEAQLWCLAQEIEQNGVMETHHRPSLDQEWRPPPDGVLKCNIGMRWAKRKKELGAAWVLRDSRGEVLLHSRHSFADVLTKDEAHFLSLAWAVESMLSHNCRSVYFYSEGSLSINAINRRRA